MSDRKTASLWNRCEVTGNPCGTDTWREGCHCSCPKCEEWVKNWAPDSSEDIEQSSGQSFTAHGTELP